MGEISLIEHILRLIPGHPAQLPVGGERLQTVFTPDFIYQADDLALIAENALTDLRDIQHLPRVDQIWV